MKEQPNKETYMQHGGDTTQRGHTRGGNIEGTYT